jgi:signal transduction histidine kinase
MSEELPSESRLILPTRAEALRALRHDLRTPINPILGYCELIEEESGDAAPPALLAGVRQLHAAGMQMLKLTNEVFSDQPSALRELSVTELQREFRAPAGVAAGLCTELERQADAATLPVAAADLRRIGIATGRWLARVEELLDQGGRSERK